MLLLAPAAGPARADFLELWGEDPPRRLAREPLAPGETVVLSFVNSIYGARVREFMRYENRGGGFA